jgi:hypothetical protein
MLQLQISNNISAHVITSCNNNRDLQNDYVPSSLVLNYNPALCYNGAQQNHMDLTGNKYERQLLLGCIYVVLIYVNKLHHL